MLDFVRREETEITKDSLERIIQKVCEINLGLKREAVDSGPWCFEDKSKLLWTYLINRIIAVMYETAAGFPIRTAWSCTVSYTIPSTPSP